MVLSRCLPRSQHGCSRRRKTHATHRWVTHTVSCSRPWTRCPLAGTTNTTQATSTHPRRPVACPPTPHRHRHARTVIGIPSTRRVKTHPTHTTITTRTHASRPVAALVASHIRHRRSYIDRHIRTPTLLHPTHIDNCPHFGGIICKLTSKCSSRSVPSGKTDRIRRGDLPLDGRICRLISHRRRHRLCLSHLHTQTRRVQTHTARSRVSHAGTPIPACSRITVPLALSCIASSRIIHPRPRRIYRQSRLVSTTHSRPRARWR